MPQKPERSSEMAKTAESYTPVRGISMNSYNAVRRRVEKWIDGEWATAEQMKALGEWLVVEAEARS
jgi:hypothetical protein